MTKHPADHLAFFDTGTNADSQTGKVLRTQMRNDRLKPVMSACRTFGTQTHLSQRKIYIIDDDQQIMRFDLEKTRKFADRDAAVVHVGIWFQQANSLSRNCKRPPARAAKFDR